MEHEEGCANAFGTKVDILMQKWTFLEAGRHTPV